LRFPDQHLAIVIVGNGADIQAVRLGERIADVYLEAQRSRSPGTATIWWAGPPATTR
jgi:hypothetical protein